jgi:hypothetical protein
MMLSSRNFGQLTRPQRDASRSQDHALRFQPAQPRWMAPLELLDAVAALLPLHLNHAKNDPSRRVVRFSKSHWREEGHAA